MDLVVVVEVLIWAATRSTKGGFKVAMDRL
jgi:hypothetical protein